MDKDELRDISRAFRRLEEVARKVYNELSEEGYPRVFVRVEVRVGTYQNYSKVAEFGSLEETVADIFREEMGTFFKKLRRDIVEKLEEVRE